MVTYVPIQYQMDFFNGMANIVTKEMWWLLNEYIFYKNCLNLY